MHTALQCFTAVVCRTAHEARGPLLQGALVPSVSSELTLPTPPLPGPGLSSRAKGATRTLEDQSDSFQWTVPPEWRQRSPRTTHSQKNPRQPFTKCHVDIPKNLFANIVLPIDTAVMPELASSWRRTSGQKRVHLERFHNSGLLLARQNTQNVSHVLWE